MKILSSTFIVLAIALCCTGCSYDRAKDNEQQSALLLEEGIARMEQHDLSAAMKRFKEAEQLLTPQSDHRMACRICEHIAWLNASSGEQQLALIYFDYALPHSWATKDESMVIDVLIGKAHVLNEMGETEHAFQVNQQAEALVSHADASQQSTMLKNRAYHQLLHDSIAEAEQNAVRALTLAADTASLGNAFALLSHIYQQQGDTRKLQQLLSRFNESNNTQVSYSRLRIQYEYYLQQHDYQRALEAYRLMQSVGDMMDRSHDQVELLKVQDQYEREASEHEKARQKWWYSLAVIVLMNLVLLIVWWNSRQQHRRVLALVVVDGAVRYLPQAGQPAGEVQKVQGVRQGPGLERPFGVGSGHRGDLRVGRALPQVGDGAVGLAHLVAGVGGQGGGHGQGQRQDQQERFQSLFHEDVASFSWFLKRRCAI